MGLSQLVSGYFFAPTFIPFIFFFVLLIVPKLIIYLNTTLTLTETKLAGEIGFLSTKSLDAPLDKLNSVSVKQGFLGQMLNYGTLVIGTSSSTFYFKGIAGPLVARDKIIQAIEDYKIKQQELQAELIAKAMARNNENK